MRGSVCLVLLGSVLACKGEPAAETPPVIEYALGDYYFHGPDTIPSGTVTIKLKLESEAGHVLDLIRLDSGKRIGDLMAAGESAYDSSWVKPVGGGITSREGTDPTYTLKLEPGVYVLLCYFNAPDHQPHFAKGMIREVIATGPARTPAVAKADVDVQMLDYSYAVSTPITAGARVIRATNPSRQPHEMIIVRLKDGFTLEQANARADSTDPKGPSPWEHYGGVADLSPGDTTVMAASFTPGTYRMFCFFQGKDEKQNHAELGMSQVFTVD
jgi:hypothetical protein